MIVYDPCQNTSKNVSIYVVNIIKQRLIIMELRLEARING